MRDRDTIDAELRLLAAVRRSIRDHGGEPSSRQRYELLDEWLRDGEMDCLPCRTVTHSLSAETR